jgi:hypothetical protein
VVAATVPGQIQLDLETAGIIGNTYNRFNQELNAWVYVVLPSFVFGHFLEVRWKV